MNSASVFVATCQQWTACVITALVFGLLCIFPAIAMRIDPAVGFEGIEMHASDAEAHYAARVREIQDGFPLASNVFYEESKNQPYLQPPLPEWVIAHAGALFGLDAPRALLFSQFLFGMALFVVMVGCFHALSGRFWWSFCGVTIFLLAGYLFSGPGQLFRLLEGNAGMLEFLTFARPVNPQWSGFLFFGALWAFVQWVRTERIRPLVIAAVFTVLSFYSYVYVWTLLGVVYAIAGARYLLCRDKKRIWALVFFGSSIIAGVIPYIWNVWAATQHPAYVETTMRLGLIATREPVIGLYSIAFLAIAIVGRKQFGETAWIVTALAVAALIAQNQQILTGAGIVPYHYHWYFIKPSVVILGIVLVCGWVFDRMPVLKQRRFVFCAVVSLVLTSLALGALYQFRSYEYARPAWAARQNAVGVLDYLNKHVKTGAPVYSAASVRDLIPIYTSADVAWATNAYVYLSPDEHARIAYFRDLWMEGVTLEQAAIELPAERRAEASNRLYGIYYREAYGAYAAIPDEIVTEIIRAYASFLARSPMSAGGAPVAYVILENVAPRTEATQLLEQVSESIYQDSHYDLRRMNEG